MVTVKETAIGPHSAMEILNVGPIIAFGEGTAMIAVQVKHFYNHLFFRVHLNILYHYDCWGG